MLLTRVAKLARPFDEEPDFDLLATLANATFLTRAGELRRIFLPIKRTLSSAESSSAEAADGDGDGLAFRLPFPLKRRIKLWKELKEGNVLSIVEKMSRIYTF